MRLALKERDAVTMELQSWLRANNYLDADGTGVWRVHCAARVGR